MKVIIDTNIIVDAIYEKKSNCIRILDYADKGYITPVTSLELEKEYNLVAGKVLLNAMKDEFLSGNLTANHFDLAQEELYRYHNKINSILINKAEKHTIESNKDISPDKDDNKIINLAIDSNSSAIITKNIAHFRCVEKENVKNLNGEPIMIMTPKQFTRYFREHKKEFIRNSSRINTINKYLTDFKAAKHWTYEDTKVICNLNDHFGRVFSIVEIKDKYKEFTDKLSSLNTKLLSIENNSKKLKEVANLINDYEKSKSIIKNIEKSFINKILHKDELDNAIRDMKVTENLLHQHGIKDRADYEKLLSFHMKELEYKPVLEKDIAECKENISLLSNTVDVVNKALLKEASIEKGIDLSFTLDR